MVRDQGLQRLLQCLCIKRLQRAEQHRLVPLLAFGNGCVEEGMLHRQQRGWPVQWALVGLCRTPHLGDCGQVLYRLVLEQVLVVKRMPAWRARLTTWIETIESPPRVKKLSLRPTRSSLSRSCQIAAICCSSEPCGAL